MVKIDSAVQNAQGNITAAELGVTQIFAAVSGGNVDAEFDGTIELDSGGSVNNGAAFTGSGATLRVDTVPTDWLRNIIVCAEGRYRC